MALADGLLTAWHLNETLADATGNGNTLLSGDAAYGLGKLGSCLDSGTAYLAELTDLTDDAFSVSMWLYADDSGDPVAIELDDGTVVASAAPRPDDWNHVVATWDGSDWTFWVNKESQAITNNTAPESGWSDRSLVVEADDSPLDELLIYGKALTADEVADLYRDDSGFPYPFGVSRPFTGAIGRSDSTFTGIGYGITESDPDAHAIVSITLSGGGFPTVFTLGEHGLGGGDMIVISGTSGGVYDGAWTVGLVVSDTAFRLSGEYISDTTGGTWVLA